MSDAEERAAQLAASPYHADGSGNGGSRKGKRRGRTRRTHTVAKVLLSTALGFVTQRQLIGDVTVADMPAGLGAFLPQPDRAGSAEPA